MKTKFKICLSRHSYPLLVPRCECLIQDMSLQAYLPSLTPKGLRLLRAQELQTLTEDNDQPRETADRIYDYDVSLTTPAMSVDHP